RRRARRRSASREGARRGPDVRGGRVSPELTPTFSLSREGGLARATVLRKELGEVADCSFESFGRQRIFADECVRRAARYEGRIVVATRGEHDDGRLFEAGQPPGDLETVEVRHVHVQQDDFRAELLREADCAVPVLGLADDVEVAALEQPAGAVAERLVVVD